MCECESMTVNVNWKGECEWERDDECEEEA